MATKMAEHEELHAPFTPELGLATNQIDNAFVEALLGMYTDCRDALHESSHFYAKEYESNGAVQVFSASICEALNIVDAAISRLVQQRNEAIKAAFKDAEAKRN